MQQGRIVIITGSPGTGKSTVADKAAMESDMEKSVAMSVRSPIGTNSDMLTMKTQMTRATSGSHCLTDIQSIS